MGRDVLRPNGAGSQTAIGGQYPSSGAHWNKVAETPSDEDTTYVLQGVVNGSLYYRDLYALPDGTGGSNIIDSVVVYIRTRKTPAETLNCKTSIRTNSTTYDSSANILAISYQVFSTTYATNPNTGSAWTWAQIAALEAGVALQSPTAAGNTRCTQVWVEVNWHPGIVTSTIDIDWVDAFEALAA
jgi:hypothetical protein